MKFTYYGQSCFLLEIDGIKVLFDPMITPNPKAAHIDTSKIEANYILVSHAHEDHTADLEVIAKRTGAKLISNFEIVTFYEKKGIKNNHPMNTGGSWQFDFGRVYCTNAVHSSSHADGSYGGTAMGFVIQTKEKTIYFAGDTALSFDFKLIKELYQPHVGIFPIGDNFTMGPEHAAIAAEWSGIDQIIGVHFDTFPFIEIDHDDAIKRFKARSKTLTLPSVGETIEI